MAACRKWRTYLRGADKVQLMTDHNPLRWMRDQRNPRHTFAQWIMELEKYKYEIIYRPGKENVLPDYLSRIPGQSRTIEGSEAQSFEDGWIYRGHGVPRALLTDQAHNIDGSEVRTLCDKKGTAIEPADYVMERNETRKDSLDVKYKGPFRVVARRGTNFKIKRARGNKWVHANRYKYYSGSGGGESISDRTPIYGGNREYAPCYEDGTSETESNHES